MKKYPMVKQSGGHDCGVASLAMIIRYYNGYYPEEELRDLTCTTKTGTNAYNIVEAASQIGFDANCYKCNLEDMQKESLVLPCIANVIIDGKFKHFVVIYKIDFKNEKVIIADPADRIKKVSFEYFNEIFNHYVIMLIPNKVIPVVASNKINYKYFLKIIFKEKKYLKELIILSLFVMIISIVSSFYIEYIVRATTIKASKKYLLTIFLVFLIIYLLKNIFEYIRSKVLIKIQKKIDTILTLDTYENILSLPYHYYRVHTTGDIISRINDLVNVKDLIAKLFMIVIVDIPLTFIALAFMFYISKTLFLLSFVIVFFYLLIIKKYHKMLEKNILILKKSKAEITSLMVESISGFETIKGLKIKKYIYTKFKNLYNSFLLQTYKYQKTYLKETMFKNIVNDLGFIFISFIGAYLVILNKLALGSLFTFNALIIYYLNPLKSVLSMDTDIKEAKCSYKRILELDIKKKEEEMVNDRIKGKITIKDLTYTFDNKNDILKNINLTIDAGDKVMVLGPSGSGKSTLFKMLLKYYTINKETIFIDDKDINMLSNSSNIKYINQIETIFTDTLYNNLTLGKDVSDYVLKEVIDICHLDKIIKKDSLGLNQIVEENGFNLSGGERQRIVLARTMIQGFDVLIIDEGLNQVDINLEREILKSLKIKYKDKTIIVISHRLNNQDLYNKVVKLNKGKIEMA
ncbi:MAG: peptidase domain-containing ABC transporter [Bacilli bacterium]|nr:peptidase domain-containing ABC transporter [Bacilli bacterium]